MAAPSVRSSGAYNSGTTSVVLTMPTFVAGDLILVIVESCDSSTAAGTPNTPGGYNKQFEETQGAGATGVTTLTIFARIAQGGDGDVTVDGVGNHVSGHILIVQGHNFAAETDVTPGTGNGGSGNATALGVTTGSADNLIVVAVGSSRDANATDTTFSSWTNANLTSITEHRDNTTNAGAGGGVGVMTGVKASAGSTGDTTVTHTASTNWRAVTIPVPPAQITTESGTIVATETLAAVEAPASVETGKLLSVANPDKYRAAVLADGPLSYWRLGEASGTDARDEMGVVGGTYVGTPTLGATGLINHRNTALDINAASTALRAGDNYDFPGYAAYTFECWVKFDTIDGTYRRIMSKEDTDDGAGRQGWTLWIQNNGSVNRMGWERWRDGASLNANTTGIWAPSTGVIYHVVGTFDGTKLRLYTNGVFRDDSIDATAELKGNVEQLTVGAYADGLSPVVDGVVDEVAVYGYALTADQILAHYNAGITWGASASEALVELGTVVATGALAATSERLVEPGIFVGVGLLSAVEIATTVEAGTITTTSVLSASEDTVSGDQLESGTIVGSAVVTATEKVTEQQSVEAISVLSGTVAVANADVVLSVSVLTSTATIIDRGTCVAVSVVSGAESSTTSEAGSFGTASILSSAEYRHSYDLYSAIDEVVQDDTDYIRSKLCDGVADVAEVNLTSALDPDLSWGHVLHYRIKKDAAGGDTITLTVSLYCGATLIDEWLHDPLSDVATTYSQILTSSEADAITDYTDLRVRLSAIRTVNNSGPRRAVVSWVEFETPPSVENPPEIDSGTLVGVGVLSAAESTQLSETNTLVAVAVHSGSETEVDVGSIVATSSQTATEVLVEAGATTCVSLLFRSESITGEITESGTIPTTSTHAGVEVLVEASTTIAVSTVSKSEATADVATLSCVSALSGTDATADTGSIVSTAVLAEAVAYGNADALVGVVVLSASITCAESGSLIAVSVLSGTEVAGGQSTESGTIVGVSALSATEQLVEASTLVSIGVSTSTQSLAESGACVAVGVLSYADSSSSTGSGSVTTVASLSGTEQLAVAQTLTVVSVLTETQTLIESGTCVCTSLLSAGEIVGGLASESGTLPTTTVLSAAEILVEPGNLVTPSSPVGAESQANVGTIVAVSVQSGSEAPHEASTCVAVGVHSLATQTLLESGTCVGTVVLSGSETAGGDIAESGSVVGVVVHTEAATLLEANTLTAVGGVSRAEATANTGTQIAIVVLSGAIAVCDASTLTSVSVLSGTDAVAESGTLTTTTTLSATESVAAHDVGTLHAVGSLVGAETMREQQTALVVVAVSHAQTLIETNALTTPSVLYAVDLLVVSDSDTLSVTVSLASAEAVAEYVSLAVGQLLYGSEVGTEPQTLTASAVLGRIESLADVGGFVVVGVLAGSELSRRVFTQLVLTALVFRAPYAVAMVKRKDDDAIVGTIAPVGFPRHKQDVPMSSEPFSIDTTATPRS